MSDRPWAWTALTLVAFAALVLFFGYRVGREGPPSPGNTPPAVTGSPLPSPSASPQASPAPTRS